MFINCPYCHALVATDPVTDLAPPHCPHCDSLLRRDPSVEGDADSDEERPPLDLADLMSMPAEPPAVAPTTTPAAQDFDPIAETNESERALRDAFADPSIDSDERIAALTLPPDVADIETDESASPMRIPIASARPRNARGLPSFLRGGASGGPRPRERWVPIAVAALALALGAQVVLADRARLANDARWRPLLSGLCGVLRCDLPPWREPAAFALLQRDVRQHPTLPGALRVTATFRNDARWSQPWPRLHITLSDGNGRVAGERSFRAEEYLGGAPEQGELASGESVSVAMDILEPAPGIVGYDFSFR